MTTYRTIILVYGEQLPDDMGFYQHPEGGTCALMVEEICWTSTPEEALEIGIEAERRPDVHSAVVEEAGE